MGSEMCIRDRVSLSVMHFLGWLVSARHFVASTQSSLNPRMPVFEQSHSKFLCLQVVEERDPSTFFAALSNTPVAEGVLRVF